MLVPKVWARFIARLFAINRNRRRRLAKFARTAKCRLAVGGFGLLLLSPYYPTANADESLFPGQRFLIDEFTDSEAFVYANFNGDGVGDIASANYSFSSANSVSILFGNDKGTFFSTLTNRHSEGRGGLRFGGG